MDNLRASIDFLKSLQRIVMDKKTKKRLDILRQKLEKNQKLLAAAKIQTDEPDEVENIEKQIADLTAEIADLKKK